ncbi:MAG: fibronectin type III domain-containing protein, partial [Prevotella sp.]|nr:fibronectin type III domain-containing protein [Prevotella sp.]
MVSAQSYTVSPTGWTSKPSTNVTKNSSTWIAATTEGIYIKAKAVVSGSTVTFYVQKSSGTFINKASFLIQEDMVISGSTVTGNGTTVATGSVSAESSGTTVEYEPGFTSGSHTYHIILASGSLIFYTNPITITAKSITLDTPDYNEFYATNITSTGFTANWEEVDGATSYNINVKESDESYPNTPTATSTTNQVKITGLKPGTAYRFQVQAVKGSTKSTWSKSNSSDIVTLANLTITGATYFGTTELTAGKEYTFTAVVKNTASVPWYGRFYLKCGDTNWIAWETPRTIAAGGTTTVTQKYTPTETGTKTLGFYYKTETTSKGALVSQGSYSNPFTVTVSSSLATPDYTTFSASNITTTGFTAKWAKVSGATSYNINVKESDGSYPNTPTTTSTRDSVKITGLKPGTAYRFQVQAVNGSGKSSWSKSIQEDIITKSDNCPFPDCPGGEICEASTYLYNLGILEGVDGKLLPDDPVTRAQLAKLSLYSLYSGPSNIPSTLVSDKFPSIYPDLQDARAYYYRPAKALLYLEYQDGVSPFDRNRSFFNPEKNIERNLVLKVICETFNIKPETSTSNNPFSDFDTNLTAWGYAKKCYDLGIAKLVNTTKFRPLDACKRKEAILYLYRVLTSSKVTVPKPR